MATPPNHFAVYRLPITFTYQDWSLYTYLDSGFCEADLHGKFLSHEHVWVASLLEGFLQLFQLLGGEVGAVSSLLSPAIGLCSSSWHHVAMRQWLPRVIQNSWWA